MGLYYGSALAKRSPDTLFGVALYLNGNPKPHSRGLREAKHFGAR